MENNKKRGWEQCISNFPVHIIYNFYSSELIGKETRLCLWTQFIVYCDLSNRKGWAKGRKGFHILTLDCFLLWTQYRAFNLAKTQLHYSHLLMSSHPKSYWAVTVTSVTGQWGMLTSLLLYPAHIRAPTNRLSRVQQNVHRAVSSCKDSCLSASGVFKTTAGSGKKYTWSSGEFCREQERKLQCEIGYLGEATAAAAAAGGWAHCVRTDGYPPGCGHQKKQSG